jgi:hypothetical protein
MGNVQSPFKTHKLVSACYSLDVGYPPKIRVLKTWPIGWCYQEMMEPLEGRPRRGP